MDRKAVIVVVVLLVIVGGSLLVRDPVAAASGVRTAFEFVVAAITTVVNALTKFFEALFQPK
ncbi:hypothetical protein GCM10009854_33520 [Saccharopolyspora halophila]|uniref:Uncharacterized protein n=1 Tax=Saccharopolyspora halophila TaxID=405551 RepID=A0ABP5TJB9_9PSEU